jgi:hypothetical protein
MQPIPPLPPLEETLQEAATLAGPLTAVAICACAAIIVAARDWRIVLAAFMIIYLGLALVTSELLPPEWALLRVIVGGLVAIIWLISAQRAGWGGRFLPFQYRKGVQERPLSSTTLFRSLVVVSVVIVLLTGQVRLPLPPIPSHLRLLVTWLAAFALLGLALGDEALQTGVALLLWLAATQLLVSALRQDPWLIWLLSTVELLVGLAAAYLIVARGAVSVDRSTGRST